MRRLLGVVWALALTLQMSPANAKLYKWVDEEGNVSYSERKPPNRKVETVKLRGVHAPGAEAAREKLEKTQDDVEQARKDREFEATIASEMKEREERLAKNCEIARENLRILRIAPRIKGKDADGNDYFLDEKAVGSKILQSQNQVRDYCK